MQKITPKQCEQLMRHYKDFTVEMNLIKLYLEQMHPDQEIYAETFSHQEYGMPHDNRIQDKTTNIALKYRNQMEQERKRLIGRSSLLRILSGQIELAIHSLDTADQLLFTQRYVEGKSWCSIAAMLPDDYDIHTEKAVTRRGKLLLERISKLLCISRQDVYTIISES